MSKKVPLLEEVLKYKKENNLILSMPGNKSGIGFLRDDIGKEFALNMGFLDITEVDPLDNLHAPEGIIKEAQELLAETYGVKKAYFVVNGSTAGNSSGNEDYNDIADYSDLGWEEQTWNFTCSTTETSTWAEGGRKFGELVEKATGGKIKVAVYAADQLTGGNQSEGIQALMDGDPVQISMHSNLIYSAFDQRLNVVSLPFLFDSFDDVDAKLDGDAGKAVGEVVESMGLHLLGIAENGFRHPTNSKLPIASLADMKGLKIRVAGSSVLNNAYQAWGANWANANWSEVFTALQTGTYDGQENPLPTADGASIAEVQKYVTYWTGVYDCIFFTMNADLYNSQFEDVVD